MTGDRPPVRSKPVARATGLTLVDRLVRFAKQAGSSSETEYDRDGFLSYHAETHAVGAGIGLGFAIAAAGAFRFFGLLLEGVIFQNRGQHVFDAALFEDVSSEKHYFLGGLVVGVGLGLVARFASGLAF